MKLCVYLLFPFAEVVNPSNWIFSWGKCKARVHCCHISNIIIVYLPLWVFSRDLWHLPPLKLDIHLRKPWLSTFSVSCMTPRHVMVPKKEMRHTLFAIGREETWTKRECACSVLLTFSPSLLHPSIIHQSIHLLWHWTLIYPVLSTVSAAGTQ